MIIRLGGYVVEPIYSKNKMIPVAEQIAYKLQAEMSVPPTHKYLKGFTEKLVEEGIVSEASNVSLHYLQLAGSSNYTVYVDYNKLLPLTYRVRGKVEFEGVTQYHEVDLSVLSIDYVDSMELPVSANTD